MMGRMADPEPRRRILERYNDKKLWWLREIVLFIVLIAAVFIVFRFVIGIGIVGGDSMDPTLRDGDLVVYSRICRQYRAGDVVSIRVPSGEYYVKRVAAVGEDVLDLRDGKVWVNGELLQKDTGYGETLEETGAVIYPYKVREGNVFVLGDNREVSMDSRAFGEVNRRQIRGKIFFGIGLDGKREL
ncbi:MAG: signal peptidase I [Eubacterium sp.]|nr:signal peptidase I [Eubacterium sp.]